MKNLGKHIEVLLQDNDCVVVPGFGGFIARAVPAHYADDEQLFFPPSRTVAFNERLSTNDGLLTGRYMHEYQVSYSDAAHMVDKAVDDLRDALAIEGTATLPGVGCLRQDVRSAITFEPEDAGIASPVHFGLEAFSIRPLDQLAAIPSIHRPIVQADEQDIHIHIGRRALRTVAAAAAVVLLLIVFAIPTANEQRPEMAGLPGLPLPAFHEIEGLDIDTPVVCPSLCMGKATENISEKESVSEQFDNVSTDVLFEESVADEMITTIEPAVAEEPVAAIEELTAHEEPAVIAAKESTAEPAVVSPASAKRYHLIVGSLPNRKGADDMVAKYKGLGFDNTSIVVNDGRYRISIASYTDKGEANAEITRLRQGDIVKSVWLLPVTK